MEHVKELFIRLAAGKCTPEERARILEYMRNDPSPEAIPTVEELQPGADWPLMPDGAAEAVMTSILYHVPEARIRPFWKRSWVRIAAAIVPLAGVTWLMLLYFTPEAGRKHYANHTKAVQTITLDDGTVVKLNQRARLSVSNASREVWLKGEVFFSVQQEASRPFVVHAGNALDVTVLGTAFNVNTGQAGTQVVLNNGSVRVASDKESILLQPGEMADHNAATGRLSRQPADTLLHTSWKYDLMAFRGQHLQAVMRRIKEQYGYEAVFEQPEAASLLFTGYLASNNLQQAMLTLEQAFGLNIRLQNNQIYISN